MNKLAKIIVPVAAAIGLTIAPRALAAPVQTVQITSRATTTSETYPAGGWMLVGKDLSWLALADRALHVSHVIGSSAPSSAIPMTASGCCPSLSL